MSSVMKFILVGIMGMLFIPCEAQTMEEETILLLRNIIDGQLKLSNQLNELSNTMEIKIAEANNKTESKITELVNKLPLIEAQVDKCATQDQVDAFKTTFIAEQQIVKDASQQCFTNQGMITFQNTLESDECADLTHNCSAFATCSDSLLHYKCYCNPGYSGDGYTCQDINECIEEPKMCGDNQLCVNHPGNYSCTCPTGFQMEGNTCQDINECLEEPRLCGESQVCVNHLGNYSCTCLSGFQKEGNTCQASNCPPPSKVISDLGCVMPVPKRITWDEHQENCVSLGGRLLEGLRREHLEPLRQHFVKYLKRDFAQIGLRGGVYVKSRLPVSSEDDLWGIDDPNGSDQEKTDCGQVYLSETRKYILDYGCSNLEPALCQILY